MAKMNRARRLVCALGVMAVIVGGTVALTTSPAEARPGPTGPPLLCGWTTIWDCTLPDGSHQSVIGTQCDIRKFERRTGASCVPATF